jgi:hypothetical protein
VDYTPDNIHFPVEPDEFRVSVYKWNSKRLDKNKCQAGCPGMLWDAAMLSSFAQEIKLEQAHGALASTTSKYLDQNTSIRVFFMQLCIVEAHLNCAS